MVLNVYRPTIFTVALGACLVAFLGIFALQWWAGVKLRAEHAQWRTRTAATGELQTQNERLKAVKIPTAALDVLRGDRAALGRLQQEIAVLKSLAVQPAPRNPAPVESPSVPPANGVPAAEWKNSGRSTPAATVETVLWAASRGEANRLSELLEFDEDGLSYANANLAGLPEADRVAYATPERLIARFLAAEIPTGTMQVTAQRHEGINRRGVAVHLAAPGLEPKYVTLTVHRRDDGWRVVVPAPVVARYGVLAQQLAATGQR